MQNSFELISVENHDGMISTTSLNIAKVFGKEHSKVLRDIQHAMETIEAVSAAATNPNLASLKMQPLQFIETTYTDNKGEARPMYLLNRDATVFLIMGYTGKKAAAFKIGYIAAFNNMEKQLRELPSDAKVKPMLTDKLYNACAKLLKDYRTTNRTSDRAMADIYLRADMLTQLIGYNPIEEYEKRVKIEKQKYKSGFYDNYIRGRDF